MPLVAFVNGERIISSFVPENDWNTLKKTKPSIIMDCPCHGHGIAKTLHRYGTQFFAHKSKKNCNYKPETPEHLILKDLIAKRCSENGFKTDVERKGKNWIADVYTEENADPALKKYIFEIQLSPITSSDIIKRSEKYLNDGIRPVWLLNKIPFTKKNSLVLKRFPEYSEDQSSEIFYYKNHGFIVATVQYDQTNPKVRTIENNSSSFQKFVDAILHGDHESFLQNKYKKFDSEIKASHERITEREILERKGNEIREIDREIKYSEQLRRENEEREREKAKQAKIEENKKWIEDHQDIINQDLESLSNLVNISNYSLIDNNFTGRCWITRCLEKPIFYERKMHPLCSFHYNILKKMKTQQKIC